MAPNVEATWLQHSVWDSPHLWHPSHGHYSTSSRSAPQPPENQQFDIVDWYPKFQSCHRYFLDHAQHSGPVQALSAFINIQLPYQKQANPVLSRSSSSSPSSPRSARPEIPPSANRIPLPKAKAPCTHRLSLLLPYLRRLVATGHDTPAVLHGFFGDDWVSGIGELHEIETTELSLRSKEH